MKSELGAVIYYNDKVLIRRIFAGSLDVLSKWEFPKGRVEKEESEEEALKRDVFNELNIEIEVENLLGSTNFSYLNNFIHLKLYKCKFISGEINLKINDEYKWVLFDDLLNCHLAAADAKLIRIIMKENKL